ncbi:cyclin-dependent kinase inhibitor 1B [Paramormyrops kingsleyae]|uniref:Cyclin-dependent kinase inhibitor 1B n=1 Tax=Paramormyrops kingsleyae TaxID=1676925 RepID=A0A3B3QHG9_9TELE|nr:cyclin-dependent kinase inhibitor 1B [Paramormyrops kingsleyae]
MSDVRLSNGSPPLERMEARVSDFPKPSACRVLFGMPNHEELQRELSERLREIEEAKSDKWNFDFAAHRPLPPGRYKWEPVDDAPEFYGGPRCTPADSRPADAAAENGVDVNGHGGSVQESAGARPPEHISEGQTDCKERATSQKRKRASADCSSQKKRSRNSSDEVIRNPVVPHSVENTPRKSSPKTQT